MRKITICSAILLIALTSSARADEAGDLAQGLLAATEKLDTTLTLEEATAHARAALAASKATGVAAELLLAMAYFESHYEYGAISRVICTGGGKCKRHTGKVRSRRRPANVRGKLFCGAIQIYTFSWNKCWWYIDNLDLAYLKGAQHLVAWLNDSRCNGKIMCALKGYRTGNPHSRVAKPIRARLRLRDKIRDATPSTFGSI